MYPPPTLGRAMFACGNKCPLDDGDTECVQWTCYCITLHSTEGQENKQPVEIQPTSLGQLGVLVSPLLTENSLANQSPHVISQPVNIPHKEVDTP